MELVHLIRLMLRTLVVSLMVYEVECHFSVMYYVILFIYVIYVI